MKITSSSIILLSYDYVKRRHQSTYKCEVCFLCNMFIYNLVLKNIHKNLYKYNFMIKYNSLILLISHFFLHFGCCELFHIKCHT